MAGAVDAPLDAREGGEEAAEEGEAHQGVVDGRGQARRLHHLGQALDLFLQGQGGAALLLPQVVEEGRVLVDQRADERRGLGGVGRGGAAAWGGM